MEFAVELSVDSFDATKKKNIIAIAVQLISVVANLLIIANCSSMYQFVRAGQIYFVENPLLASETA